MNKRIIKILAVSFVLILLSFLVIEGLIIYNGWKMPIEEVDYVIILGARLYGTIPSPALRERLIVARDYLFEHKGLKVVVSGGQGANEDIPEANAMEQYLISKGIDKDRIIVEDKSTSTYENIKFSLEKIREEDNREELKILLVTNRFHVFRAKFLGNRLGVVAYGLPAKTPPSIILNSYLREYFAVIKSFVFDVY
jgi:uncharacterized SAM-binding protein YcdF (DUF218 family)